MPFKRCLCVLILGGRIAAAAPQFVTGQAARLVIGQPSFTALDPGLGGTNNLVIGAASGLAIAGDTLFVADANRVGATPLNNRVLIYRRISTQTPKLTDAIPQGKRCNVCVGVASVVVGQPDFATTTINLTQAGLRTPTSVASDGQHLVVADTDNNRVLIWNSIPASNGAPADVVVGQSDFTHSTTSIPPTAKSMRGPQGVWIQNGRLYVADTQNHRVLIYNSIPTVNGAAADLVLGQPNLTTYVEPDLTRAPSEATATNLLNPVSVTSDGVRLIVTDLGHHRVLIWNSIPTANQAPADVSVGQPDLISGFVNHSTKVCASNGTDSSNNPTYPARCGATLSFPRYALSDGTHLFIADGGNDRVLIYSAIPTQSGKQADIVLGQTDDTSDVASAGANYLVAPMSLAWDGANLFVSDPYNLRISVFTAGEPNLPITGVRNAASREVFAVGTVTLAGTITAKDTVTITLAGKSYTYTIASGDTFPTVLTSLVSLINAGSGDPNVLAVANPPNQQIQLTARTADTAGNAVTLQTSVSSGATIIASTSSATLSGGQNAAQLAPGTLISAFGTNLADGTLIAPGSVDNLPTEMGGVHVYVDGIRIPLLYVSPTQINAQIPWEVSDASGVSLYVRTTRADGSVTVTNAVGVPIVPQHPGIFAQAGADPRPAAMVHGSAHATGVVSVDGSIKAGEIGNVVINGRTYTYTVQSNDTLASVRDALITLINRDPEVSAFAAGSFARIRLEARTAGAGGEGIPFTANVSSGTNLILTPIGLNNKLCCANQGLVTVENPALPGEVVKIYATGLGLLKDPATGNPATGIVTGQKFAGGLYDPLAFVSALAGGSTANVLLANLLPGMVGVYELDLQLGVSLTANPLTQLTISQSTFTSNVVTFPLISAPLTISSSLTLPSGSRNQAYLFSFGATGGTSPYTWALTSGSVPAGLSLASTGILSGTPTAAGTSVFTVQVTDGAGVTKSGSFALTIN